MKATYVRQLRTLIAHSIQLELADKQRLIAPLLLGASMMLMFAFALGTMPDDLARKLYVAETFLTLLFALQISFAQAFEPDRQDFVFALLRSYPVYPTAWFLAKFLVVFLVALAVVLPTILLGGLLHNQSGSDLGSSVMLLTACLALVGLTSIGILLSAMTLRANGRHVLYPILYFPLATPVLLGAIEVSMLHLEAHATISELWRSWLGLLLVFDVIYVTLGLLLFGELIKAD